MKPRIDGSFVFSLVLGVFALVWVIGARNFPPSLRTASYLSGYATLALICILLAGAFRPEILRWTESALQDLWGSEGRDEGTVVARGEQPPPWPAVLRSMGYAVGFLLLTFLLGLYLVPPLYLATYLIVEAGVRARWAILAGVIATVVLIGGMQAVDVEVWAGIVPEIIPGYLGGAIPPPI